MTTPLEPTPAERYEHDVSIPCPQCHAETGKPCVFENGHRMNAEGFPLVHLNRRIKRLILERRPDLLEPMS